MHKRFEKNPHNPTLRNHALHGNMDGLRTISVTPDIRIVFQQYHDYIVVLFFDVGTHSQLYR